MSAAPAPPPPTPPSASTPAELVRWIFNVHNRHDPDALRPVVAPEALVRMPMRTLHGRDAVVDYFHELYAAVPDAVFTLLGMAAEAETVMVRWRLTGTHRGAAIEGLEATGARLDVDGVDHFTIRAGVVVANVVIFDQMQYARQLGLLPPEGSRIDVALRGAFNLRARRRRR